MTESAKCSFCGKWIKEKIQHIIQTIGMDKKELCECNNKNEK